jgi:hypothetical protein
MAAEIKGNQILCEALEPVKEQVKLKCFLINLYQLGHLLKIKK